MGIKYRPEIDGLRTVAVLSVIIYHAEFIVFGHKLLPGGFLGVDVFFVISGFLITSLMIKELHTKNTISISSFYERRARRLLPALFTVMLASLPLAWILLLPEQLIDFSNSIISSLLFGSNFYWNFSLQQYGAESSLLKPFLHTWSLAVEEQYYIIFPLALLALHKYWNTKILLVLSTTLILSLIFAEWMNSHDASFSFYMLPSRLWELLAGAITAYALHLSPKSNKYNKLSKSMPLIGLLLITTSICLVNFESARHPGVVTILPVLGTVLIIGFSNTQDLVTRILSSKGFVSLGLVSYSLYLWHYPLFAFYRIKVINPSNLEMFCLILTSVILSYLTYLYIEKKFRCKQKSSLKVILTTSTIALGTLIIFSIISMKTEGGFYRFTPEQEKFISMSNGGYSKYVSSAYNNNALGKSFKPSSNFKLLIIGDSYSQDFYNVLYESGYLNDVDTIAHYIPARCRNVPHDAANLEQNIKTKHQKKCAKTIRVGDQRLQKRISEADGIIVASSWVHYTAKQSKQLLNLINTVEEKDILFIGIKRFGTVTLDQVLRLKADEFIEMNKKVDSTSLEINKIMKQKLEMQYLDLLSLTCNKSKECPIATPEGGLISYDGSHLTKDGAIYMGQKIKNHPHFINFWAALTTDKQ